VSDIHIISTWGTSPAPDIFGEDRGYGEVAKRNSYIHIDAVVSSFKMDRFIHSPKGEASRCPDLKRGETYLD